MSYDNSRTAIAARWREVAELAGQGLTSNEIAARTGMNPETIKRTAPVHGIEIAADPVRATSMVITERWAHVRQLAGKGLTSHQIAQEMGLNAETVRRRARVLGIDIPGDNAVGRSRAMKASFIVQNTLDALEGLTIGLNVVNVGELDRGQALAWAAAITASLRKIDKFATRLREETRR